MKASCRIYIAQSRKTMLHYCFRIAHKEEVLNAEWNFNSINDLLCAKSQKQMVQAISNFGLLYQPQSNEPHKRIWTLQEFIDSFESEFEHTDAKRLAHEMFLESSNGIRANHSGNSPAACFDAFDTFLVDNVQSRIDQLPNASDTVVLVEPIQDWMMLRNSLSITASLLGDIAGINNDNILVEHGFELFDSGKTDGPVYAIPLKFNAYFWFMNIKRLVTSVSLDASLTDYLFWLLTRNHESKTKKGRTLYHLNSDQSVFMTTMPIVTGHSQRMLGISKEEDRNLYLCVRDSGSQAKLANKIIAAFWEAFEGFEAEDGSRLGIQKTDTEYFWLNQEEADPVPLSLSSQLFYTVFNHPGRYLISCKRCKNAFIAPKKGPAREYCSDSCRVLSFREE